MRKRLVIEIEAETYLEEQYLIEEFPDAVWLNMHGKTRFYLSANHKDRISESIQNWKEMENDGEN